MENKLCCFCDKELLKDVTLVKIRGLRTIVETSKTINDRIWKKLESVQEIEVHKACRNYYTKPSTIIAKKREINKHENEGSVTSTPTTRSKIPQFDYKTSCLFCEVEVSVPDSKLSKNRRKRISMVQTFKIKDEILKICNEREDDFSDMIKLRVENTDLIAAKARYHHECYVHFRNVPKKSSGETCKAAKEKLLSMLIDHIEQGEECQYSLHELKDIVNTNTFEIGEKIYISDFILKSRLESHFQDQLIITENKGGSRQTIFSFLGTSKRLLYDKWYLDRKKNTENERLRIIEKAAEIIKQDIRSKTYEMSVYPSVEEMGNTVSNLVPDSLQLFMNKVVQGKLNSQKENPKIAAINHAIISACRPRSFISPIQLGLAVHLHCKFGSRYLIDILHSLSLSSSYNETIGYLNCASQSDLPKIQEFGFMQFAFDNADVNTRTLDGKGTVHILGGIQCITPTEAVSVTSPIVRDVTNKMNPETKSIPIVHYKKQNKSGLKEMKIKEIDMNTKLIKQGLKFNLPWISRFLFSKDQVPFWNGYMQDAHKKVGAYATTKVLPVPFINLEASNPTAINSALMYSVTESQANNKACIATFDQPLFIKASEIVLSAESSNPVSTVHVRLGGFHLLMSFLGSIGYIMKGSGIEELWSTVYAKNTIPHLLSGHAFSRSLRAHFLTVCGLFNCLADRYPELKSDALQSLVNKNDELLRNERSPEETELSIVCDKVMDDLHEVCEQAKEKSRTAKLWLQYIDLVILVMEFISAERTGNWKKHIEITKLMIPIFHAAGHNLYAKCAHLYLQLVNDYEKRMSTDEFQKFTTYGYFTVRHSSRFWSGIWTDMVIEQSLNRPMKSIGGLTHGRGINEGTLLRWISSLPLATEISRAVEQFTNVTFTSTEQHKEQGTSRQARDHKDVEIFCSWFLQHSPFHQESGELINVASGLVVDDKVTCDQAIEKGMDSLKATIGKDFSTVVIHRKDKVTPLAVMNSSIIINNELVTVNTQQLFNRIVVVINDRKELKKFFEYELAPQPPALFDNVSLRKTKKSSLVQVFKCEESSSLPSECVYVIDGGHLLHSVIWPRPATYEEVFTSYVSYVKSHYGDDCTIVFDGYPNQPTIKNCEQKRRAAKRTSANIKINNNSMTTTTQADFLSNSSNKKQIIDILTSRFRNSNIRVSQAESDADCLIVSTATEQATAGLNVVVVGQDTDLLVLLTAKAAMTDTIFFYRPGTKQRNSTVFKISRQKEALGEICDILLFAHAVSGCDTTSGVYNQGKIKCITTLKKNEDLRSIVSVFNQPSATKEDVVSAGETFLLNLYGYNNSQSLNEVRYFRYNNMISKQKITKQFDLASLPPTSAAAAQHSLRVYLQVQHWMGNMLEPTLWGWTLKRNMLLPVSSSIQPVPPELLKLVSCSCKTSCSTNHCECKKSGLQCSAMCTKCQGVTCGNCAENVDTDGEENDD